MKEPEAGPRVLDIFLKGNDVAGSRWAGRGGKEREIIGKYREMIYQIPQPRESRRGWRD